MVAVSLAPRNNVSQSAHSQPLQGMVGHLSSVTEIVSFNRERFAGSQERHRFLQAAHRITFAAG
jgi:hypothetical protein